MPLSPGQTIARVGVCAGGAVNTVYTFDPGQEGKSRTRWATDRSRLQHHDLWLSTVLSDALPSSRRRAWQGRSNRLSKPGADRR